MDKGQIFKIHSDFYYVYFNEALHECKLREILKKQGVKPLVGDFVFFEKNAITEILERSNFIPRPAVANVNQIIIVSALKEPDLSYLQLNRYIAFAEYYKITPILCFNKDDLISDETLLNQVKSIYQPLGYKIVFTSAKENDGISELINLLSNKTSALCGTSGVGKSSLINAINPALSLRTKEISKKTMRGTHTTRHCEIIQIDNKYRIIDTPGFSNLKFDFLYPRDVDNLFVEMKPFKNDCKYPDCLHLSEDGCCVLANKNKMATTRYQSYIAFVEEAQEFKNKVKYEGKKIEKRSKYSGEKRLAKISAKSRSSARNTQKQNIYKELEDGNIN